MTLYVGSTSYLIVCVLVVTYKNTTETHTRTPLRNAIFYVKEAGRLEMEKLNNFFFSGVILS